MRIALTILLPLLLPLLLFVAWRALGLGKSMPQWFEDLPWVTLLATGTVLAAVTLTTWTLMDRAPAGAEYVPPRLEDGKIVPGGFKGGGSKRGAEE